MFCVEKWITVLWDKFLIEPKSENKKSQEFGILDLKYFCQRIQSYQNLSGLKSGFPHLDEFQFLNLLFDLLKKGIISFDVALAESNLSLDEFQEKYKEYLE